MVWGNIVTSLFSVFTTKFCFFVNISIKLLSYRYMYIWKEFDIEWLLKSHSWIKRFWHHCAASLCQCDLKRRMIHRFVELKCRKCHFPLILLEETPNLRMSSTSVPWNNAKTLNNKLLYCFASSTINRHSPSHLRWQRVTSNYIFI